MGSCSYISNAKNMNIVGVTSYVVGSCGSLGVVDGFARVSYQMDWIRENSDNYVKLCSAKLIQKDICIKDEDCDTSENQICSNGQCRCKLGFSKEKGIGNCVDDCVLLKELNQCSNGIFKVNKMLRLHFSHVASGSP